MRLRPLVLACAVLGCEGPTGLHLPALTGPPSTVNQYRGEPTHQGLAPASTRLNRQPKVVWSAGPFGIGTYDASKSTPAISEDRVYVGEDDGLLRALDRETGAVVWSFATRQHSQELGRSDTAFTGVHGSPAFDEHHVYIGDYAGWLYAVDRQDGSLVWQQLLGGSIGSSPVLDGELVFIAVEFPTPDGKVFALRASDGTPMSESAFLGHHIHGTVSLDETRRTLVVGNNQGLLVGLSASDLTLRWQQTVGGAIKSTSAIVGDLAMVTAWDGALHAVSLGSGEPRFQIQTQDRSMSSPAVLDGIVCFGSHDGSLTCAQTDTGQVRWRAFTGDVVSSSPVMVRDAGLVVVGSCDGTVHAFAVKDGSTVWKVPLGTSITSVPVAVDHSVFINDDRGTVWRLDAPE
jgi:outer membrane protein assembly factor BamB